MCGIIGYVGKKPAAPILMDGLMALKYRGYDSAGIALWDGKKMHHFKVEGKPERLQGELLRSTVAGTCGIGHNRWATHGKPSKANAHPQISNDGTIAVVHNGTIENFRELREELETSGYIFKSQTDTEVLPHLIHRELTDASLSLAEAVERALAHVSGAYGIAVVSSRFPNEIVGARMDSPLIVGIGSHGYLLASDEAAICEYAQGKIEIENEQIVILRESGATLHRFSEENLHDRIVPVTATTADRSRGGFAHIMHKEIHDQPQSVENTLRGRLNKKTFEVRLGGLTPDVEQRIARSRRIIITACGTSYYAGLVGKLYLERFTRKPVEVVRASELKYGDMPVDASDVVIGVSQSGETRDTVDAMHRMRKLGALCLGITNQTNTQLPKITEAGVFLQAGPEHAVASTKAYTAQTVAFALMAIRIAHACGRTDKALVAFAKHLASVPSLLTEALKTEEQICTIAEEYRDATRMFVIGRRYGEPVALEAELKLQEVAYMDAHGMAAGELKHGPLALIEEGTPVFAICRRDGLQDKMLSNMEEVHARGGHIVALTTAGDARARSVSRHVVELPDAPEELTPMLCAPTFQLLAYYLGVLRGNNVDEPRNLAKSVTVE